MRWMLRITAALCLAIYPNVGGAQAPDKFTHACALPFDAISVHRPIDTSCENEGRPKPEDGAVDANKEQNRPKNNFCAAGSPVSGEFVDRFGQRAADRRVTQPSACSTAHRSAAANDTPGDSPERQS